MTVTVSAVVLGVSLALTVSQISAERDAQAPPAGPAGATGQAGPPPGGGRGANPAAALYTEHCASCHGTDLAGGRAPSLFREQWLASTTDERLTNAIRTGVAGAGMPAFG